MSGPRATPTPRAPEQHAGGSVAATEVVGGQHGEQPHDASTHREGGLRSHQRQQHMIAPGVRVGLVHVGKGTHAGRASGGRRPRLLHRSPDERDHAAATRNDAAFAAKATSRPNTVATSPPSPAPTASIAPHSEPNSRLALVSSSGLRARFGKARLGCWRDERSQCRDGAQTGEAQPQRTRRANQQQPGCSHGLEHRHHADDRAPVEAIRRRPGHRRHQERGERLRHVDHGHQDREAGQVLHEADERDVGEPVAGEGHHLRHEQRPDVPIGAQHRPHAGPVWPGSRRWRRPNAR